MPPSEDQWKIVKLAMRFTVAERDQIDNARGEVPRERWIRGAVRKRLEQEKAES